MRVFWESRVLQNCVFLRVTWLFLNVIKRATHVSQASGIMAENMLGEWSDGDDDWIWEIDDLREQSNDESAEVNTLGEWSDGNDDWIWDVDESDLRSDPETDDTIQTGRGEKRKSDESLLPEKDFYEMESVTKHKSKKFQMTATDHTIRFNNVLSELDLIERM